MSDDEIIIGHKMMSRFNEIDYNAKFEELGDGISEEERHKISAKYAYENLMNDHNGIFTIRSNGGYEYTSKISKTFNVVGLDLDSTANSLTVNQNTFNIYDAYLKTGITRLYSAFEDKNGVVNILEYAQTTEDNAKKTESGKTYYTPKTALDYEIDKYSDFSNTYKWIFWAASIAFGIFAVIMLANFISVSILDRKKEIGILRAMGARKLDIIKIFLIETFIIIFFVFVLVNITLIFLTNFINYITYTVSHMYMIFWIYSLKTAGIIFLISILIGIFSAWAPSKRFSSMQIIKAIKD